ncbi:SGNH hydrolase-type esterase superfamily protein, partial [Tanacetum coccineum]
DYNHALNTQEFLFHLPVLILITFASTTPPVAATVFLGANDAALPGRTSERQYVPLEEYKENLRKIVRHLKTIEVTGVYAKGLLRLAKEFRLFLQSNCAARDAMKTQGWHKKFLSDGLHLTPDGNKVVFEEVLSCIQWLWLLPLCDGGGVGCERDGGECCEGDGDM